MKIIILLFFFSINNCFAAAAVDLFKFNSSPSNPVAQGRAGPAIAKLSESCQKMVNSNLYMFAQQTLPVYMVATSPVIPFTGFVMGLTQDDSPMMRICQLVIGIDKADLQGIIGQTGAFLNNLTGNRFDEELGAVDSVFNVANSLYNFEDGTYRPGAMTSASTHYKIKELLNSSAKVYNKRKNGKAEGLETKMQRKQKLDAIASLTYQRSNLSEAGSCPSPRGDVNYLAKYTAYTQDRRYLITEKDNDANYYYDKLVQMGTDFIVDLDDLRTYMNQLNQIMHWSYTYQVSTDFYTEKDSRLTGNVNRDGVPERRDQSIRRKVNIHQPLVKTQTISDFKNKYVKKWESWIGTQSITNGFGSLFDDKKGNLEAKYRSYTFECTEKKLMQASGLQKDAPDYESKLREEVARCQQNLVYREKDMKNIMERHVDELVAALGVKKKAETEIWNYEAMNMGYNREVYNVTDGDPKNYQKTEVACSNSLTSAEMTALSMKSQSVRVSLREELLKADTQEMVQEELKAQAESDGIDSIVNSSDRNHQMIKNVQKSKPTAPPLSLKNGNTL